MAEDAAVSPQNEDRRLFLSDEGAAALVFLLGSQLETEQRSQILVEKNSSGENEIKYFALTEIIEALEAKQGNTIAALFKNDDERQLALAKALQVSRSQQFFTGETKVEKNSDGFGVILQENQARLVMQWMGWNPDDYSYLDGYKKNIFGKEIKKAKKKFTIVPPAQVDLTSSIADQAVSRRPNLFQSIFRRGQNHTTKDAASPPLQNGNNGSPKAAADPPPTTPSPQPVPVPANMSPVASANATPKVISFEEIPYIENPFKKTYMADRIENVGWFVHRAAGLVALGAVAAVAIAPFATGLAVGAALTWGAGATFATYGLGFGLNQLSDILRGFESPKVKQQRDNADQFELLATDARKSLIRDLYAPAIRGQIIEGLSPALQEQLARQAKPPAPAVAAPAPVAEQPETEPVVAQTEPVAEPPVAEPPVAEPPAAAQTVAAQTDPAPAPAASAAGMITPKWGYSASYELYGIDTQSNLSFLQNASETPSFNISFNKNIKLSLIYKSSLDANALQELGLIQFQRTN